MTAVDDLGGTLAAALLREFSARGVTLAVAESLTGGLLSAELIRPAGASAVVVGAVVAYDTALKNSILGVDAGLLEEHGPVHPDVAIQMAEGIRRVCEIDGRKPTVGVSTTGVAGPDSQGGHQPGTVFVGFSSEGRAEAISLQLAGSRDAIRRQTVERALDALRTYLR